MKLISANTTRKIIDFAIFDKFINHNEIANLVYDFNAVELCITNDEHIQELNKIYRGKDKATDVLSFSFFENQDDDFDAHDSQKTDKILGQIIISIDTATRQAKELGQSLEKELEFLFVHGLLHLLGYDHENPEDEKIMLEKAYKVLGRV